MPTNIHRDKTIPIPVFRDERSFLYDVKEIVGHVAQWAVRQSPYPVPDKLEEACLQLTGALQQIWQTKPTELGFVRMSRRELRETLERAFKHCPLIEAWNKPRSGHNVQYLWTDRYSKTHPDDDFIDLDALMQNVVRSLLYEHLIEAE